MLRSMLLLILSCALSCAVFGQPSFNGDQLSFPKDYREWVYLSSGLGMTYGTPNANARQNFDNVFVEPKAYREFVSSGKWPEGSMFVLEIRGATSEGSINKGGNFQQGIVSREVSIKDSKRFPKGSWGYFDFGPDKDKSAAFPPNASCYACHSTNAAVENTFVQFYPTLIDIAKAKGTFKNK